MPKQTAPLYNDMDQYQGNMGYNWSIYQTAGGASEYGYGDFPEGVFTTATGAAHDVILMGYKGYWYARAGMFDVQDCLRLPNTPGASDTILMGYKGYRYNAIRQDPNDIVELVTSTFNVATLPKDEDIQFAIQIVVTADLAEYGYGDSVEIPLLPPAVGGIVMMSYKGYTNRGYLQDPTDNPAQPPAIVRGWDTDTEQQKYWILAFGQDTLLDEEVEKITISNVWDNDSENQKYWIPGFSQDDVLDNELEKITLPFNDWTLDSEQQKLVPPPFGMDDISDSGVERIVVLNNNWDTDTENQKYWIPLFSQDSLSDEGVERIILPPNVWDNDSENQRLNPLPFGMDELSDSGLEKITIFNVWDTDGDNQKSIEVILPYQDVMELGIGDNPESPIIPPGAPGSVLMSYKGYWYNRAGMHDPIDIVPLTVIVFDPSRVIHDDDTQILRRPDSIIDLMEYGIGDNTEFPTIPVDDLTGTEEHQKYWIPLFGQDGLSDEGIEKITLPFNDWTLDSEQQRLQSLPFSMDDVLDSGVERIVLPFNDWTLDTEQQKQMLGYDTDRDVSDAAIENIIIYNDYTLDSEYQLAQLGYTFDRNIIDENVESLQYAQGVITGHDTDAENQKQHPDYYKDHLSDEEVEKITFPIVVLTLTAFDNDAENQKYWNPLFGQDTLSDEEVEIIILPPAAGGVVMMSYKGYRNSAYKQDPTDNPSSLIIPIDDLTGTESHQKSWLPVFGQDTLSDEGIEKITLKFNDWTLDTEQQLLQLGYTFDRNVIDENVESLQYARGVITNHDTDADYQKQHLDYYKDHLSDEEVEKITFPLVVPYLTAFDNDSENQKYWIPKFGQDTLSDEGVEIVITPRFDLAIDDQFAQDQRFKYMKDDRGIQVQPTFVVYPTWEVEEQFPQRVVVTDYEDKTTNYVIIPTEPLSMDVDHQLPTLPSFRMDEVSDTGTEKISLPFTIHGMTLMAYRGYTIPRPAMQDTNDITEIINVVAQQVQFWDNDAENQLRNPDWNLDWEEEKEGVPYLAYAPGVIRDWGWEVDNQIPTAPWTPDLQGWDYDESFRELFIIVPLFYRISTEPLIIYKVLTTIATIGTYITQTQLLQAIADVESEFAIGVTSVSTGPVIGITSVDTSMIEINRKK